MQSENVGNDEKQGRQWYSYDVGLDIYPCQIDSCEAGILLAGTSWVRLEHGYSGCGGYSVTPAIFYYP